MTKDEMLWGNIRFLLLLIFSVAAIYIILCRYILNVPTEDSSELINEINCITTGSGTTILMQVVTCRKIR